MCSTSHWYRSGRDKMVPGRCRRLAVIALPRSSTRAPRAKACTVPRHARGLGASAAAASNKSCDYAFSFGLIADAQYCDIDDGTNFRKDEVRCYRGGLGVLDYAVRTWNAEAATGRGGERGRGLGGGDGGRIDLVTVMQLGDLIDGQNNGTYGAGLKFPGPRSDAAWTHVREVRFAS